MAKKLNHKSIGLLDEGRAAYAIDKAIKIAVQDLEDRGKDEKERKVVIEIVMIKPKKSQDGIADIHVKAKAMLPEHRTDDTRANIRMDVSDANDKGWGLEFSEHNAGNPDQRTILDEVDEK